MAEVLSSFPDGVGVRSEGKWRRYLDGQIWRLRRGEDFQCEVGEARSALYMAKDRMGFDAAYRVKTIVADKTIGHEVLIVQLLAADSRSPDGSEFGEAKQDERFREPAPEYGSLPEMLTVEEVGAYLRVGRNTAYEMVKRGTINSVRFGKLIRIPRSELRRG